MTIPKFEFEAQDLAEWRLMSEDRRDHILGNVLATMIHERDVFIKLVGPLSSEVKDTIIHSHRTWFDQGPPARNFRLTIVLAILVLAGAKFVGSGWVASVLMAAVCFFAVGIPLSQRDSVTAISRITVRNPEFFDLMWSQQLILLAVPALGMKFDAREGQAWQAVIACIVGVPDVNNEAGDMGENSVPR